MTTVIDCKVNHDEWRDKELSRLGGLGWHPYYLQCEKCRQVIYTDPEGMREEVEEIEEKLRDRDQLPPGDWIVIDTTMGRSGMLHCRRCDEKIEAPTNIKLNTYINMTAAFGLSHILCEEKKDEKELPGG